MKKIQLTIAAVLLLSLTSCYDFYRQQSFKDAENEGKSILVKAESEKKALIEQAKAENEAATLQAEARIKIAKAESQAEVERAYGVAKANEIIGQSLKGNTEYLRYLMIQNLGNSKGERIYIPTEAGLPILEAK
jgi:regulator of protease activity HflC (stomatin/prohibitin superfamily)